MPNRRMAEARRTIEFRGRRVVIQLMGLWATPASTRSGLSRLSAFTQDLDCEAAPIFLLGAGWRTGSTLLQRMVNAVPGTLIWGEPYSEGAIVQRLSESVKFLDESHGRFHGTTLEPGRLPSEDEWTATMAPSLDNLVQAYRALLDRLFQDPAASRGCARWGVKEVVWDLDCIHLLNTLYPAAKFVLLVREPQAQWRSYRPETWRPWFYRWPDKPIGGPHAFGAMWRDLVSDFLAADRLLDNATIVRYEDLRSEAHLERLRVFLGLETPLRLNLSRVGSSGGHKLFSPRIPAWERALIDRLTRSGRTHLGYL